jgi:hypothetical protein
MPVKKREKGIMTVLFKKCLLNLTVDGIFFILKKGIFSGKNMA